MVESDNKILCLGQDAVTITDGLLRGRTSFFKMMPDRKIDTSFNGNNPIIYTLYPGTNFTEAPFEMIPNGNDGFFAAGIAAPPGGQAGIFLLKVKSDGKVDSTYGNNGFSLNPGAQMPYPLWSPTRMKRARNGGFLMTGLARNTGSSAPFETAVYRFSPQGLLDRSFGENGVAVMKFPPAELSNTTSQDVLEDDQNRLWVAHAGKEQQFSYATYAVSRFLSDGRIDSSYDGSGFVITALPNAPRRIYLGADGLPILTGYSGIFGYTTENDMIAIKVKPTELSIKPKSVNRFKLAPNVVNIGTPLQVKLPQAGAYQISYLSLDGKSKTFQGKGHEFIMNTSDLKPGIYLITIQQNGNAYQAKMFLR